MRKAGKVTGAIPAETVQKQGAGEALPLNLHDDVNWKDVVKTENTGRVRIALLDGSVLNVGARSEMRIVEHNAQTEQTQIEMTLGRMRSHVVKLTKKGSSFEVKTQTAVIGVVGTTFIVEATPTSTRVICIEGKVTVENINPSVRGRVQLQAGESTLVNAGFAPTAAAATSAAELQTALNRTEVQPGLRAAAQPGMAATAGGAQPVARGTTPGASGAGTTMSLGSAAAVAAGGASAGAGGGESALAVGANRFAACGAADGAARCGVSRLSRRPSAGRAAADRAAGGGVCRAAAWRTRRDAAAGEGGGAAPGCGDAPAVGGGAGRDEWAGGG